MDSLLKSLGTMVMALLRRRKRGKLVRPPRDIALQDGALAPASGPTEKPHWQKAKGSLLHPAVKTASCVLSVFTRVRLLVTPWTVAHQAPLSMDSPGKNTGVGCHALLQGIFLTQGSKLCPSRLLHWQGSLPLVPPGKPQDKGKDANLQSRWEGCR